MTVPAAQDPSLGFTPGDHVCAFYSSSRNVLDDIVVDYITQGLQAGNKVFAMVDQPSTVQSRVPAELIARDGMLNVLTEDEAYMPDGSFSKDGYGRFQACGDESFIVRNGVDINEWFAAEAELNHVAPDHPHFFFCLYDLDLFDGDTVMRVLRTHPRLYVNGIVIGNPHYEADRLPG
jgi:hypothetical protein